MWTINRLKHTEHLRGCNTRSRKAPDLCSEALSSLRRPRGWSRSPKKSKAGCPRPRALAIGVCPRPCRGCGAAAALGAVATAANKAAGTAALPPCFHLDRPFRLLGAASLAHAHISSPAALQGRALGRGRPGEHGAVSAVPRDCTHLPPIVGICACAAPSPARLRGGLHAAPRPLSPIAGACRARLPIGRAAPAGP